MNAISKIRALLRGALLAACIPALALLALAATAGETKANPAAHPSAAPVAQAGSAHSNQTMPAALRPVFYQALVKDAGATYNIKKNGCAVLPRKSLEACFDDHGAHFTPPAAKAGSTTTARSAVSPLSLHLVAVGRGDKLAAVTSVRPEIAGNEASYRHGAMTEWWRVLPVGYEQGFTIAKRPSGNGELTLALAMSPTNADTPSIRHSREGGNPVKTSPLVPLRSEGGKEIAWGKLRYGQLVVTDANGKVVPATLTSKGDRILIAVNDAHAAYPLTVDPLVWLEQKVVASDGAAGDWFGFSVAISGTTALIGAPFSNSGQGAAYVFGESGGSWTQTAELAANDGAGGDGFGASVALAGTTALVGANAHNNGQGAVYVFSDAGGSWTQTAELVASDGAIGSNFGISVALSSATAVVGALTSSDDQGAAYVFGESGGSWTQTAELTASDEEEDDEFGYSVAISGTTILVGAYGQDNSPGAAYVFSELGGSWTQTAELTPTDGAENDRFGYSVAVSGTTGLVGAPNHDVYQGAAYVFNESGGSWTQTAELTAPDEAANDGFGTSVALDGPVALVGASGHDFGQGAAYVFSKPGASWLQTAELTASDGAAEDLFGISVALDGPTALVGAIGAAVNGNQMHGAAYFEGESDLDLLTTAPYTVSLGDTYLVQGIATNEGTETSPPVAITMTVPAAASFVSASSIPGSCGESANLVTCDFGPLGVGSFGIANINLKVVSSPGTTIANRTSVANSTPKLSNVALTQVFAICPGGYLSYSGTLLPNRHFRTPTYQSAAGGQTVLFSAPLDFLLHVRFQKSGQSKWFYRKFPFHAIYEYGPAGTYEWQINAGPDGGAYTLCILHP